MSADAIGLAAHRLVDLSWGDPAKRVEYSRLLAPWDSEERAVQMASEQSSCALTVAAILLIAVPTFLPLIVALGIDPIHFGLVMILNLLIGATTPPFGVLLFIVQDIAQVSFAAVVRAMLPFYVPLFVALVMITYWPDLSLWLPRALK